MRIQSNPGAAAKPNQQAMERAIFAMQSGDRDALRLLYAECADAIYAYALSRLKQPQDAEDVLHDSMIRAWDNVNSYQARGKPMAWMLTIAKNLCYDRLRARNRFLDLSAEDWEAQIPVASGTPPEERLTLEACLGKLTDAQRQVVVLHAVAGLKHREIAVLLQMPLGTVLSHYRRAIGVLRNTLEQEAAV